MKRTRKYIVGLVAAIFISTGLLSAENILRILEGYGRDSISTFSVRSVQSEAARLFNLILEPNGKVTTEKAEEFLNSAKSKEIKAYLAVMLADYSFVNKSNDSGLRYLKRAIDEHDPIRNDSYYRLVLDRAQKEIKESRGKEEKNKHTILSKYAPDAIKEEPIEAKPLVSQVENTPENDPARVVSPAIETPSEPNFRIQVGAYSSLENAERRQDVFKERGYPVKIEKRERSSGYLYIVRVGAYDSYDQAKNALAELKAKYSSEDGIVIKVEK